MRVSRPRWGVYDHVVRTVPANASDESVDGAHHHEPPPDGGRLVGYQIAHRHAATDEIGIMKRTGFLSGSFTISLRS